jgi:hypothetical protein
LNFRFRFVLKDLGAGTSLRLVWLASKKGGLLLDA